MTGTPAGGGIGHPIVRASAAMLLGLGLAIAVVLALVPDVADLRARVDVRFDFVAVSFVASALGLLVTALRWQCLAEGLGGTPLPWTRYTKALALNRLLALFLPAVLVEVVGRSTTLRAAGSRDSWGRLGGVIVLERLADLVFPLALVAWGLATRTARPELAWGSLALVATATLIGTIAALHPVSTFAAAVHHRLRRRPLPAPELPAPSRQVRRALALLSAARYACVVTQFWALGVAAGVTLPALALIPASAVAQLAMIIAVTPGGLGFQEGGWAGGLAWQGVEAVESAVFILAARVGMVLNFAALALVTRWLDD